MVNPPHFFYFLCMQQDLPRVVAIQLQSVRTYFIVYIVHTMDITDCYLGIKEFSFNLFSEPTLPTTPSYQTTTKTSSNQTKITTLKEISSMTTPKPHTGMTTPKRNSVMTTQTNQATMTTSKGETLTFT